MCLYVLCSYAAVLQDLKISFAQLCPHNLQLHRCTPLIVAPACESHADEEKLCVFTFYDRTPPYDKIWEYSLQNSVRTMFKFIVARQLYLSLPAIVMYTKSNYASLRFTIVRRRMERSEDILCATVSAQRSTSSLHANYTSPCLR